MVRTESAFETTLFNVTRVQIDALVQTDIQTHRHIDTYIHIHKH